MYFRKVYKIWFNGTVCLYTILLHVTRLLVTHDSSLVKACSINLNLAVPRWLRFHLQTSAPLVFFIDGAMTSLWRMFGEHLCLWWFMFQILLLARSKGQLSLHYPLISRGNIQKKSFTKIQYQNLCKDSRFCQWKPATCNWLMYTEMRQCETVAVCREQHMQIWYKWCILLEPSCINIKFTTSAISWGRGSNHTMLSQTYAVSTVLVMQTLNRICNMANTISTEKHAWNLLFGGWSKQSPGTPK